MMNIEQSVRFIKRQSICTTRLPTFDGELESQVFKSFLPKQKPPKHRYEGIPRTVSSHLFYFSPVRDPNPCFHAENAAS